jgi:hypothetical protein
MKKKILLLSLLFIVFVVWWTPAKLVEGFIPANGQVTVGSLSGSAFSGSVSHIEYQNWYLESIDYQLSFLSLLSGSLGGDSQINKGDIQGQLTFYLSDEKNAEISNANLKTSASNLASYMPFPGVSVNGELSTEDFSVRLAEGKPDSLFGATSWKNGSVTVNGKMIELGSFDIDWTTEQEDQSITGVLRNSTKNSLDLQGRIKLNRQGQLEFTGSISNRIDQSIYTPLSLFASGKASNGRLPIKFKKKVY